MSAEQPEKLTVESAPQVRKRRPRDSLSREIIVAAAERVAQRDGLDRLTFQSLGEELDAHPTSIYRHFRDKDELMLELIDTFRSRAYDGAMNETDDWIADLRAQAHLIHDNYMRYPEFALQMAIRRPTDFTSVEFSISALRRGGFAPAEAALYSRALGQLVRSASSIQAALEALSDEVKQADEVTRQMDYARLSPEDHPALAWLGSNLRDVRDKQAWETALDLMLESIERRAPGTSGG